MLSTEQELKVSRMNKRSQNKKLFGRDNYRLREFVLQPFCIRYFEVSGGNRGKEKGQLALSNIKFIEKVQDDDLDNKKNVFQIAYAEDPVSTSWYLLYIVANSAIERDDWISLVRFYTGERGARFVPLHHPGVWKRPGRYTCCDAIDRLSMGCQPTNEPGPPVVVERLWRVVSGADQPHLGQLPSAQQPTLPSQQQQQLMTAGTTPPNSSSPSAYPSMNVQQSTTSSSLPCADITSTGIQSAGAAMLSMHPTPISLSAVHGTTTSPVTLSTPHSGVILSTQAVGSTTTSPAALFHIQQQQQIALLGGVNMSPFANPTNALRRSSHNPNRTQLVRCTHQPLFDM
ncbi:PH domain protein, partial [Opisthorchis viverrini]